LFNILEISQPNQGPHLFFYRLIFITAKCALNGFYLLWTEDKVD